MMPASEIFSEDGSRMWQPQHTPPPKQFHRSPAAAAAVASASGAPPTDVPLLAPEDLVQNSIASSDSLGDLEFDEIQNDPLSPPAGHSGAAAHNYFATTGAAQGGAHEAAGLSDGRLLSDSDMMDSRIQRQQQAHPLSGVQPGLPSPPSARLLTESDIAVPDEDARRVWLAQQAPPMAVRGGAAEQAPVVCVAALSCHDVRVRLCVS